METTETSEELYVSTKLQNLLLNPKHPKACLAVEICDLLSMLVNRGRVTVILLLVVIIIGVLIILGGAILQYTLSKQFEEESNS